MVGKMSDSILYKRSVTSGMRRRNNGGGPMMGSPLTLFPINISGPFHPLLPELPQQWSWQKDWHLRNTIYYEPLWASALRKALSKIGARAFEIKDTVDSSRRTKQAQRLLLTYDGSGWVTGIQRTASDYLTTDNGAFVEIVHQSSARGSKIIGLMHLDSRRSLRTGDPQYPVMYRDRDGFEHYLKDYQVMTFSDMPRPDDELLGVGFCAASGAYSVIQNLAAIRLYEYEKVSGNGATAIHIIQGLSPKTLESIISSGDTAQPAKGLILYKGAIVASVMGELPINLQTIELKGFPDGFNKQQVIDDAIIVYANNLGVQVQDLRPLSGQFGAGQQTQILDEAAASQGQAAFIKDFEHQINMHVLIPDTTTFHMSIFDLRDQRQRAEVSKLRADTRKVMIENGEITAAQSLQMAVDDGDAPREFLTQADQTPGGSLLDSQKPLEPGEQPTQPAPAESVLGLPAEVLI